MTFEIGDYILADQYHDDFYDFKLSDVGRISSHTPMRVVDISGGGEYVHLAMPNGMKSGGYYMERFVLARKPTKITLDEGLFEL